MRIATLGLTLAALMLAAGCTSLAPDYQRPQMPVPNAWPVESGNTLDGSPSETSISLPAWQDFILDQRLRQVIQMALEHNRDLRIAVLNIEKSRAQYTVVRSEQLPSLDISGSSSRQRQPADLAMGGQAATTGQHQAGLGINAYEVDLFGRVRSMSDAAQLRFLATREAAKTVQLTLISDVASAYLALAADQERLDLARRTLATQQSSYELIARSHELGAATLLDVRQAQTQVESARVDVARYGSQVLEDRNALALLAGQQLPESLLPVSQTDGKLTLAQLTAGLPSEVLLQRPDVLQAELLLEAANADIGTARAAFFPRISLTGIAGTASASLSDLFSGGSGFWQFLPRIDLPIFNAGRNRANLEVSEVEQKIAVARYEKAVQSAFRDVADVMARRSTLNQQLDAQRALVQAQQQYFELSQARFSSGADSYLAVLDAQRGLYAAQQNLISLRLIHNTSAIMLYKALGGGWRSDG